MARERKTKKEKVDSKARQKQGLVDAVGKSAVEVKEVEVLKSEAPLLKEETPIVEEEIVGTAEVKVSEDISSWVPKTEIGRKVKSGEIASLSYIIDSGLKILEPQIVDVLVPNIENELLLVGQAKGKFGGGQRRIFKQTQKKTREGNKPSFLTVAVVGNKDGYIGVGFGKSRETVPAKEKAIRKAKLNIFKISRGCGSWECGCRGPHTIPFEVAGKCGSVRVVLKPAPKGKGLVVESELAKMLKLAGIKDIWSKTFGQTPIRTNLVLACVDALKKLIGTKVRPEAITEIGIIEGPVGEARHE